MWNKEKSVLLTQAIVRICYVLLGAAVIALPIVFFYYGNGETFLSEFGKAVIFPFYAVVPAGYIVLACIDKLLINIRNEKIFVNKNVKLLRIISWCCFYAAVAGIISYIAIAIIYNPQLFVSFLILAAGEAFMGLVVRVVKNIFEAAIKIKDENDLTI
ncbi:MAG: DUF2975 domain-containing protein [Eubacterium sp.]